MSDHTAESDAHVRATGCGLTMGDFADSADERCADGGLPIEHPCSGCGGDLERLGTCCWADTCGDCEDANEAERDGAR